MVKPVCVQPIGWPLRRFWRCDCIPQTLARSNLPLAASGGAKLIGMFALTITACLLLKVTMVAFLRYYQYQKTPLE